MVMGNIGVFHSLKDSGMFALDRCPEITSSAEESVNKDGKMQSFNKQLNCGDARDEKSADFWEIIILE